MAYTDEQLIQKYLAVRAMKADMEQRHKAELDPLNEAMRVLENVVGAALLQRGANNTKTPAGTAFFKVHTSVSLTNKAEFIDFAVQKEEPELLEIRASKSGIQTFMEDHPKIVIPGVKIDKIQKVNFRSA